MKVKGKIYLIGAGPGAVDLLTVRAAELLARADVVVYDPAANPAALQLAPAAAELIPSPPETHDPNSLLLAKAREGKTVVWLQAGDPFLPGEGGERADALASAQVPIEVVPGVSPVRPRLNWCERRPLFGQRIVVTRARDQAVPFRRQLTDLGAQVIEIPTIKIVPPIQKELLAESLLGIGEYDWLVFTSPNGVTTFFDYFLKGFQDLRAIGNVRIAAVGPGTAAKIGEYHLRVDVVPKESLGRNVAAAIHSFESVENLKVLLLRAEVANPDLPKALEELGAIVDDAPCYRTVPETEDRTGVAGRFLAEGADWITFTSGSTVENFHARFDLPKILKQFPAIKLASIGPETSKALQALGLQPAIEARQHTIEGLVSALQEGVNGEK